MTNKKLRFGMTDKKMENGAEESGG